MTFSTSPVHRAILLASALVLLVIATADQATSQVVRAPVDTTEWEGRFGILGFGGMGFGFSHISLSALVRYRSIGVGVGHAISLQEEECFDPPCPKKPSRTGVDLGYSLRLLPDISVDGYLGYYPVEESQDESPLAFGLGFTRHFEPLEGTVFAWSARLHTVTGLQVGVGATWD